jgi:3-oxoacyl-[acyl-carrier-protein] synthase II
MIPLSTKPTGVVPTEGGFALILEELEHARRRDAPIYCEISGFGSAAKSNKRGMLRAFAAALGQEQPDLVFSDAKSTETDNEELSAINELPSDFYITNTRGFLGHGVHTSGGM